MIFASRPICIRCWTKLKGPDREPARLSEEGVNALGPGARWTPCFLCEGFTDDAPGIFMKMYGP